MPADVPEALDGVIKALRELVVRKTRDTRDLDQLKLHPADGLRATAIGIRRGVDRPLLAPPSSEREAEVEDLTVTLCRDVLEDNLYYGKCAVRGEVPDEVVPRWLDRLDSSDHGGWRQRGRDDGLGLARRGKKLAKPGLGLNRRGWRRRPWGLRRRDPRRYNGREATEAVLDVDVFLNLDGEAELKVVEAEAVKRKGRVSLKR